MHSLSYFLSTSVLFSLSSRALGATTTASVTPVCSKSPYRDLSFLASYQPAQSYCTQYYPQPVATTTITVSAKQRRAAATTTKPVTTTTSCNAACSAFSSFSRSSSSLLSTLCSCIETKSTATLTVTATTTTTTTTATTTTTTTTTTEPTTSAPSPSPTACQRLGCFTDSTSDRTLQGAYFAGDNSPSICQAHCAGYTYFGVEYGSECFCGNSINTDSSLAPDSECNFKCNNDPNQDETCGGDSRIEIYQCS